MSKEEIINGNILILGFMGTLVEPIANTYRTVGSWLNITEFHFHSDWNELMPVWVKIMQWGVHEHGVQWTQEITQDAVQMSNNRNGNFRAMRIVPREPLTIGHVYGVIIDFITWHNAPTATP